MNVTLISSNYDAIDLINRMYCAARTCYSLDNITQIRVDAESISFDEKLAFVKKVLSSGHHSIAEHITFTYGINGVSRSLLAQITRHRLCTFSVQSQRYCCFAGKQFDYVIPPEIAKNEELTKGYVEFMKHAKRTYDYLIDAGIKAEDARFVLPNAATTNITVSTNLRNLMHIMGLRLCNRAQWEIRKVFEEMKAVTVARYAWMDDLLQPQCVHLGYCPEKSSCKRFPSKQEFLKQTEKENK